MSKLQISRSPDLQKLRNEGFDIEVRDGLSCYSTTSRT